MNLDSFIDIDQKVFDRKGFEGKLLNGTCVIKTHLLPAFNQYLEEEDANYLDSFFKQNEIFYVKRDGKDVMVSLFHYIQNFDQKTRGLSFSEFLRSTNTFDPDTLKMSRPKFWAYHVRSWQNASYKTNQLSFEKIIENYQSEVRKVARLLGLRISSPEVDVRLKSSNYLITFFSKAFIKLGLNRKNTAVGFRKGQKGEHKKYFQAEDFAFFDRETNL